MLPHSDLCLTLYCELDVLMMKANGAGAREPLALANFQVLDARFNRAPRTLVPVGDFYERDGGLQLLAELLVLLAVPIFVRPRVLTAYLREVR